MTVNEGERDKLIMTNNLVDNPELTFSLRINILFVFLALFVIILINNAWVNDDAYTTFRTIDNFINGYGLRWNVIERVQAYTNPLWMFVLSGFYFFTREIYFTSLIVSILMSVLTVYLVVFKIAKSAFSALLAVVILISSKAFLEYSASGLENPLTNLLIVLFFMVYLKIYLEQTIHKRQTIFLLAFIVGLAIFNRMDNILIFMPALVLIWWENRSWKNTALMIAGFIPFILWELFSLIYYGFLFPNTAYAKLGGAIPHYKLALQGIVYLVESLLRDPITLFTIGIALLAPFWTKQRQLWPLVLGILISVMYVINVGGDFMSGRFLSTPLLCAVIVLSQISWLGYQTTWSKLKSKLSLFILVLSMCSLITYLSPINWIEKPYEFVRARVLERFSDHFLYVPRPKADRARHLGQKKRVVIFNVSNEKGIYYPFTGLWLATKGIDVPTIHYWAIEGQLARQSQEKVFIKGAIGLFGFYAGPDVHIIDLFALSDPLLARLRPSRVWRVGHLERTLPQGYVESIKQNKNLLVDKKLAHLYDQLRLVTQGDLFDPNRWRAIWSLNFGSDDK
jgi:arabinofuranosyltransferase